MKAAKERGSRAVTCPREWRISRAVTLRALALVYATAFLSLGVQMDGLFLSGGIMPVHDLLDWVQGRLGGDAWWRLPTLAWLDAGDGFLRGLCWGGFALACAVLVLGTASKLWWALLFAAYLSLVHAGGLFFGYQWDALLLEAGFLAILAAPWGIRPSSLRQPPPGPGARLLFWWLVFRLMLLSGLVKLTSGDEAWRHLTALEYHYWTQPLPVPLAFYAHHLPSWFHQGSEIAMFVIEIGGALCVFGPRRLRLAGCGALVLLQVLIMATGNYGFFNLLTIALCLSLVDDAAWRRLIPSRLRPRWPGPVSSPHPRLRFRRWLAAPVFLALVALGALQTWRALDRTTPPPEWMADVLEYTAPFEIANPYGLFAVMTTERPELIVEGSDDLRTWKPYRFRWKPGDPDRAPRWCIPHMPRLDWQLWFAALQGIDRAPWTLDLAQALLEGRPAVLALMGETPFPDRPPRYLRITTYDYRFTSLSDHAATGRWWQRTPAAAFLPPVTLEDGRLALAR